MPSYIDQISNSGPKVWYRFNETAGTPINFGSLSTTSAFTDLLLNEQTDVDGRAIYFNGSSSSIQLPAHAQFALFNDRSFTVETWVRILNTDTNRSTPLEIFRLNAPSSPHYVVYLQVDGTAGTRGKVRLGSSWTTDILSTNAIDDGTWHHIVYTYNTSSVKLYIDGTLNASTTPTNLIASFNFDQSTKKLIGAGYVGTAQSSISQYFKGRIDEFAAYDYELTSGTILDNFNAGASVTFTASVIGTATALMVQPTISATFNPSAQSPMTASAASGDHYNSTVTFPMLLSPYMSTLSLETWFKFDEFKALINSGTGTKQNANWLGDVLNGVNGGIQGYGSISLKGASADTTISQISPVGSKSAMASQCEDEDFTIGFWVKKLTKEATDQFLYIYNGNDNVQFRWNADGGITFRINGSNTDHDIASSTDITDGEWHFVVGRLNSGTMQLWIDNTSIGTLAMGHGLTLSVGLFRGGGSTDYISISQFFISTSANVTSTEIGNMYTYGIPTSTQANAYMPSAAVKFDSAFNTYIQSKSPLFDFRMDEASGVPENFGSATITLGSDTDPQGYLQSQDGLNNRSFKFTNRNQALRGSFTVPAGTLSTAKVATLGVLFKHNWKTLPHINVSMGGTNPSAVGMYIQSLQSGAIRVLWGTTGGGNAFLNGTTDFSDDKWHLVIAVADGTNIKIYVDGKLEASTTGSSPFTDTNQFAIGAPALGVQGPNSSFIKYIDEAFATNTAFTEQEAFEAYQALRLEMDTTATALMVQYDSLTLGTGNIYTASPMTASGLAVMPTETQEIAPTIIPMYATALFAHPNYGANAVIDANFGTTSMTADAEFHLPQYNIGETNSAASMNASVTMVHPTSIAGGAISVNPFIALNATLVDPGIVTIKGALVRAQTLNANAFAPLPPQYFTIADDLWYQRLVAIDQKDSVGNSSIVFFNTSDNFYVPSSGVVEPIPGSGWNVRAPSGARAVNMVTSPLPAINGGYFDAQNRKAVNFKNIEISTGAPGNNSAGDKDFTFETMIKTTKSNQVLFVGENDNNYNFQRTGIILRDGKLALTYSKDGREGSVSANDDYLAFTGFKNIADGQWHHLIIQLKLGRIQFWIDGQLDIQRYGNEMYFINRIGYNSPELNSYSDFTISAFGLGLSAMVEENEINLNYLAAINVIPVKAGVATATATFTTGTRGKGNRARALMLYFWPTFNAANGYYVGNYNNPFAPVGVNDTEGKDVGDGGPFDYDTFYGLTTYLQDTPQKFFDWDVFPLPVQRFYAGDTYRGDRNPLLKDTVRIGDSFFGDVYKDNITDNYRYLDLIKDVYELDQYDTIFFRNYPDQSGEQDKQGLNSKTEVDEYFNLQEKTLFKEFLDSLRQAVDEYGISLFVTNPQLAVDLGIIEAASPVDLMRDAGSFLPGEYSDNRAPVVTGRVNSVGETLDPVNQYGAGWDDTFFNDRHRVINTLEYLTDDNTFIWTDYAYYQNADELNYGGPNRLFKAYTNRPNGLQIGDEFIFADSGNPRHRLPYQAIKPEHLKAGIPITALGTTEYRQYFDSYQQGPNPYKDYITTVALPAGTNLKGKLTGGKIFVSFSENVANSFTAASSQFGTHYVEYHEYDMASNYWVDIAFNAKIIDANTQALYKNNALTEAERGQPTLYDDNDIIRQYWSLSGMNIISQAVPITRNLKGFVGGNVGPEVPEENKKRTRNGLSSLPSSTRLRDALGRFASGGGSTSITGGNLTTFKILTGRTYDTGTVFCPSINTRGLWWLSDKNIIEGKVVGGVGMSGSATIPSPVVTADHPAAVTANHMLAQAALVDNTSGTKNNLVLPLTASVFMPTLGGKTVIAQPAEAFGFMPLIYPLTETDYTVTLYLNHTDPILYIRKEVIK